MDDDHESTDYEYHFNIYNGCLEIMLKWYFYWYQRKDIFYLIDLKEFSLIINNRVGISFPS